jgi:hypothetical protein
LAEVFRKTYRALTDIDKGLIAEIKNGAWELHELIEFYVPKRERELAQARLEECVMWAVKGITA